MHEFSSFIFTCTLCMWVILKTFFFKIINNIKYCRDYVFKKIEKLDKPDKNELDKNITQNNAFKNKKNNSNSI